MINSEVQSKFMKSRNRQKEMSPPFLNSAMRQRNLRCFFFLKLAFGNKNSVMLKFGQTCVVFFAPYYLNF